MCLTDDVVQYCQDPLKATIRIVLKKILHSRACKIDKDLCYKAHDETHSQLPLSPANATKRSTVRAHGKCTSNLLTLFRAICSFGIGVLLPFYRQSIVATFVITFFIEHILCCTSLCTSQSNCLNRRLERDISRQSPIVLTDVSLVPVSTLVPL